MKQRLITLSLCAVVLAAAAECRAQVLAGMGPCVAHNIPPAQRLMEPGPGVGGPGPGVIRPGEWGGGVASGGIVPTMGYDPSGYGAGCGPMGGAPTGPATSQIAFLGVEGGEVSWDVGGQGLFDAVPLVMPGRQNFYQGAIYRLKLTNLPDRPGVELYPTLEVAPVTPRTDAFLAHSPIPVQFTDEDLDQVLSGNFVTKVIYLPDPEFQELALAGVETLVSTRLEPGVDPIAEADRRGSIMAILRVGNLDLQLPGAGLAMQGDVTHAAQVDAHGNIVPAQYQCYDGSGYQGNGYGGGAPMGMNTAGFAPQAMPPHLVSGMSTPEWGMPSVGTPIGLPGPPHIPLGHEAGLTKHVMKNHTRMHIPPPVHKMKIDVKQRPGMDYPRPVNHVNIAETNRAGFSLFGHHAGHPSLWQKLTAKHASKHGEECPEDCPEGYCPE